LRFTLFLDRIKIAPHAHGVRGYGFINWKELAMSKGSSLLFVSAVAAMVLSLTGCIHAPFVPPTGAAYSQFSAPLDVDFQNTDMSGMKKGTAETTSILGLVAFGNASSKAAAENGQISKIVHADYEYSNIFGIIQKTTVIVYGK
jgi:hypothetical protein